MKIALLSYGYLTKDPRVLEIANILKLNGWNVICVNLFPEQLKDTEDSILFKNHQCYNVKVAQPAKSAIKRVSQLLRRKIFSPQKNTDFDFFLGRRDYAQYAIKNSEFLNVVKDVDLFYCCEMFWGAFIGYYVSKHLNKPFIFDVKELYSDMTMNQSTSLTKFIKSYEKLFLEQSEILPSVSDQISNYYQKNYDIPLNKFMLLPNTPSLHPDCNNNLPSLTIEMRKIKLVMLGNYAPEIRGIELLLKIWTAINPENATLDLYLSNLDKTNRANLLEIIGNCNDKSIYLKNPVKEDDIIHQLSFYDIGIIPYLPDTVLSHRYCCPGKFGQYLKAGLMILSSDTENITKNIEQFQLGRVYPTKDFIKACQIFEEVISNIANIQNTKERAKKYFTEIYHWENFGGELIKRLDNTFKQKLIKTSQTNEKRLTSSKNKVLVIHFVNYKNKNSIPRTVLHSLEAFEKYSEHDIDYVNYNQISNIDFNLFNCIIVHYYSQVYTRFSKDIIKKFKNFKGKKIFFAQDDYDHILMNQNKYLECNIDVLYSPVVDNKTKSFLYPDKKFQNVLIKPYLTGYCESEGIPTDYIKDLPDRNIDIFYRGNDIGYAYGELGQEKYQIGVKIKEKLASQNFNLDIACEITEQIYGLEYYLRLGNAKATLLTESGSSIIFNCEKLMKNRLELIDMFRKSKSSIDVDSVKKKYSKLFQLEGKYKVAVISPKAFEAIICRTAIIAFEGSYSGVLFPDRHYISLKKDYSNLDEIVEKINDISFLNKLTNTAYEDIVSSNKYSYKQFIEELDSVINQ